MMTAEKAICNDFRKKELLVMNFRKKKRDL